jgi:hypothetical protein
MATPTVTTVGNNMVNLNNASAAKRMLELIAQRSGEDRANVFLDIIIDTILHKGDHDVWTQQQALNRIAGIYGVAPPTLKLSASNDIPF